MPLRQDWAMPPASHSVQTDLHAYPDWRGLPYAQGCAAGLPEPRANRLLAALADTAYQHWLPHLQAVDMPLGMELGEAGRPLKYAYFPTTCIVALSYGLQCGHAAAVSIIGREAIVGISMFMGDHSPLGSAVVINGGKGFRLAAAPLMTEFNKGGAATRLLLRYTQALMVQMAQVVVCIRHHSVDQRLCRFLLSSLDRIDSTDITTTQELISNMLGVRRESVTAAASNLQAAGLIRYGRGYIAVLDRPGLERRTCECHGVVKKEYERLLSTRSAE